MRDKLDNPKYIGRWPWGATRTIRDSAGRTKQIPVPPDQVAIRHRPELALIEQPQWDKAQAMLAKLTEIYGHKAGQKPRGAKPHHGELYPDTLLARLVHCGTCKAMLWQESSGPRKYLGCSKRGHGEAGCTMATRVPVAKAEAAMIGFVGDLFTGWPDWMDRALMTMRSNIADYAQRVPKDLGQARARLDQLNPMIERLVDELLDKKIESEALRRRLQDAEAEAARLNKTVAELEEGLRKPVRMPDRAWVQQQLGDLLGLLKDDTRRAAGLLRALVGRIEAHEVIPPGKKRGFVVLKFRIDAWSVLRAVLGEQIPASVMAVISDTGGACGQEFCLPLGAPSKIDAWGPRIVEMRRRTPPVPWKEIWEITGLGSGPAFVAYKRYLGTLDDDKEDPKAA